MQRSLRALLLLPTGALPPATLELPVLGIYPDGPLDGARTLAVDVTALLGRFGALEEGHSFGDGSGI